jgi:regulator of RNase E activity RraA
MSIDEHMNTPITPEVIRRLAEFDSPSVSNVIELFDVVSRVAGYTNADIRAVYPELPPAVGYAVTATFRAGYPSDGGRVYAGMAKLIELAQSISAPRIMVFQDLDDPVRAATYGEVMASTVKAFDFAGLITSGAARDIEQVRSLKFPCWASSTIVSHGYCRFEEMMVPVTVGGLRVQPGDLIHADANGIISIPRRIAPAVAEMCGPFVEAEQIVLDYLRRPAPTSEGLREANDRMRAEMETLRQRAQSSM